MNGPIDTGWIAVIGKSLACTSCTFDTPCTPGDFGDAIISIRTSKEERFWFEIIGCLADKGKNIPGIDTLIDLGSRRWPGSRRRLCDWNKLCGGTQMGYLHLPEAHQA